MIAKEWVQNETAMGADSNAMKKKTTAQLATIGPDGTCTNMLCWLIESGYRYVVFDLNVDARSVR